jgi:Ca-activated chloride channel family protein
MNILQNITFLNPWYFWLLLFVPIILWLFYKKQKSWINFLFLDDLKKVFGKNSLKFYTSIILLGLILINFIVILANPNITNVSEKIKKNGIDIVIALDVSGSMEAQDLKPNRLEAAKNVISNFIRKLKTDRVWLVVFAWKPFTSIPLTFDYNILEETLSRLSTDSINQQKRWLIWTAIWDAILMSKTLFKTPANGDKQDKDREKVIILLTDWDANVWVDPVIAWLAAKKENIKIYTIWIWSEKWGYITYNIWGFLQRQKIPPLNDKALKQIAKDTRWVYFRATNNEVFKQIFEQLQKLEKNDIEVEVKKEYKEYYDIFIYSLVFFMILFFLSIIWRIEINNKK